MRKKEFLVEQLQLPKDVLLGMELLRMTGNRELQILHFRQLLTFSDQELQLQLPEYRICIQGKRLKLDYYSKEEIRISGSIESICYQTEKGKR